MILHVLFIFISTTRVRNFLVVDSETHLNGETEGTKRV